MGDVGLRNRPSRYRRRTHSLPDRTFRRPMRCDRVENICNDIYRQVIECVGGTPAPPAEEPPTDTDQPNGWDIVPGGSNK